MNTDTGKIYTTQEEIRAAQERGEPLVEIDNKSITEYMNRTERRSEGFIRKPVRRKLVPWGER